MNKSRNIISRVVKALKRDYRDSAVKVPNTDEPQLKLIRLKRNLQLFQSLNRLNETGGSDWVIYKEWLTDRLTDELFAAMSATGLAVEQRDDVMRTQLTRADLIYDILNRAEYPHEDEIKRLQQEIAEFENKQ